MEPRAFNCGQDPPNWAMIRDAIRRKSGYTIWWHVCLKLHGPATFLFYSPPLLLLLAFGCITSDQCRRCAACSIVQAPYIGALSTLGSMKGLFVIHAGIISCHFASTDMTVATDIFRSATWILWIPPPSSKKPLSAKPSRLSRFYRSHRQTEGNP